MEIVYKINEKGYPIVDYPPAMDDSFLVGTKEVLEEGAEVYTPQELQDAMNKEQAKQDYQDWKVKRQEAVDNIEVTYNGILYQGDEKSQDRMSRAINGLPDDTTTIPWIAKDNSEHLLTRVDLQTILGLAGAEQSRIWTDGRPS